MSLFVATCGVPYFPLVIFDRFWPREKVMPHLKGGWGGVSVCKITTFFFIFSKPHNTWHKAPRALSNITSTSSLLFPGTSCWKQTINPSSLFPSSASVNSPFPRHFLSPEYPSSHFKLVILQGSTQMPAAACNNH